MIKIYQIYFKEDQVSQLEKDFIPYDNINNYNGEGEFYIFLKEYLSGNVKDNDITGYLSWRFKQKTQISGENFKNFIENNPGNDLYFINPYPYLMNSHHNSWMQGEGCHPGIINLIKEVFSQIGYDPDLITSQRHDTSRSTYCNYWVGNKIFWDRYIAWCKPIYYYIKTNNDPEFRRKMFDINPSNGPHCYFGYILERIINVFINLDENKDLKVISYK